VSADAPVISSRPSMKVLKKLIRDDGEDELPTTDPFGDPGE
jgi:hypothetical protein